MSESISSISKHRLNWGNCLGYEQTVLNLSIVYWNIPGVEKRRLVNISSAYNTSKAKLKSLNTHGNANKPFSK